MDSEKKLMIPESGISEYPEYEVKAKIRNIFVNEKTVEKCSGNIYEKKKKRAMDVNTYYSELMFIFLNIF